LRWREEVEAGCRGDGWMWPVEVEVVAGCRKAGHTAALAGTPLMSVVVPCFWKKWCEGLHH